MIEYKILKAIEENPVSTQRTLAEKLGVSLGKINYVITGLAKKGIIKAQRLKNDPGNIRWSYLLTPDGISEKIAITKTYLDKRLQEFEKIQHEIAELRQEVRNNGSATL